MAWSYYHNLMTTSPPCPNILQDLITRQFAYTPPNPHPGVPSDCVLQGSASTRPGRSDPEVGYGLGMALRYTLQEG